mmetsp:Transcript_32774/g.68683  ORF Transcript_32774/g.68683 Transcript_32774/m.68683 type:complete len:277 (+) Transcript_32774:354-1184(+)
MSTPAEHARKYPRAFATAGCSRPTAHVKTALPIGMVSTSATTAHVAHVSDCSPAEESETSSALTSTTLHAPIAQPSATRLLVDVALPISAPSMKPCTSHAASRRRTLATLIHSTHAPPRAARDLVSAASSQSPHSASGHGTLRHGAASALAPAGFFCSTVVSLMCGCTCSRSTLSSAYMKTMPARKQANAPAAGMSVTASAIWSSSASPAMKPAAAERKSGLKSRESIFHRQWTTTIPNVKAASATQHETSMICHAGSISALEGAGGRAVALRASS